MGKKETSAKAAPDKKGQRAEKKDRDRGTSRGSNDRTLKIAACAGLAFVLLIVVSAHLLKRARRERRRRRAAMTEEERSAMLFWALTMLGALAHSNDANRAALQERPLAARRHHDDR